MTDISQTSVYMSPKFEAHAGIGELLLACCPSAIVGSVIAVTVFAINRVFLARARSHVSKEIFKTRLPAIADFYPASAVQRIRNVFFVFATIKHSSPDLIFGRRFAAARNRNGHSVGAIGFTGSLDFMATATKRVSRFKIGNGDDRLPSTNATAKHSSNGGVAIHSNLRVNFPKNDQFSKIPRNIILTGTH